MNEIYDYIEAGFRFFPIWNIENGKCTCGNPDCTQPGKHPRISQWNQVPHWSDEQTEAQLKYTIKTGAGIALDNHLIIDIDPRNGGNESFKQLVKNTGIDFMKDAGFIVKTGGGGYHIYYTVPDGLALYTHLDKYKGLDFKGRSSYVVAAGSLHISGNRYEYEKGFPQDVTEAPKELISILEKKQHHRAVINNQNVDITDEEIASYLSYIPSDCSYEEWIRCGMAIHYTTNGASFEIWDTWSNKSNKYPGRADLDKHWHSFGKSSTVVTLGTLIHYAESYGYQPPVTFDSPEELPTGDHPFPIDTVDLLRPPGFVGELTKWINDQCLFPREYLAAAAAIGAVGNICGLRYTDDINGITTNTFMFMLAGSSTGKESILQSLTEIHIAAGISAAVVGDMKSEQEIMRNLIDNQAAFYIIDEFGHKLQKITNAQKRGGAAYLEGAIGALMSAYSKANGHMLVTGDTKRDLKKALASELSQCKKLISENEDENGSYEKRIPQIKYALQTINIGIEKPFLSLIGVTSNISIDGLITFDQAANGFIGRTLIINERETNPRRKKGFKPKKMDERMRSALQNLYKPGCYSVVDHGRIENYSDRIKIKTEKRAAEMLESVADWIEDYAEQHKSRTGLEAVVRRGYEMCAKISLILAIPGGLRTSEHVRFAYMMMRYDIDEKINLAYGNMMGERRDGNSQSEALRAKIANIISHDHGESFGVIKHRCGKWNERDIQAMLDTMEGEGRVVVKDGRKYRGKVAKVYYLVG